MIDQKHGKQDPSQSESTCTVQFFEGELKDLKRYIYSPCMLRFQIYQYIRLQYFYNVCHQEVNVLAVCLLFIAVEGLDEAKRNSHWSQQGMWQQEVQKMEQNISVLKEIDKKDAFVHFFNSYHTKNSLLKLQSDYQSLLQAEQSLILQKSEKTWRLLQFHLFSMHNIHQANLSEFEVDMLLQKFSLQLTKKQNELRLNKHIQQCTKQQQKSKNIKEMMRVQTYLPVQKHSFAAFPAGFTVKQLMLLEINLDTVGMVQRCEAHLCPYIIFCLPFLYLLAQTLAHYATPQHLYIYRIFCTLISRVNQIKNSSNPQMTSQEIDSCMLDAINFRKYTPFELPNKLGVFLRKHQAKMSTFIPVYFHIFSFHAFEKHKFVDQLFSKQKSLSNRRKKMKQRIQEIFDQCEKYNSSNV